MDCVSTLSTVYKVEKEDIEREFMRYYGKISVEENLPFSGVVEICDYICSIYGKNVTVSHRRREGTVELLSAHNLIDKFANFIVREDGYPRKPDPASFIAAFDRNNLEREETINIGDREIDLKAGQSARIFSCLFGSIIISMKPDLLVENFEDLYRSILDTNAELKR